MPFACFLINELRAPRWLDSSPKCPDRSGTCANKSGCRSPYAFITSNLNYRYTHGQLVMLRFLVYRLRLTTVNASPELQPLCNHNRRIGVLKTSGKIDRADQLTGTTGGNQMARRKLSSGLSLVLGLVIWITSSKAPVRTGSLWLRLRTRTTKAHRRRLLHRAKASRELGRSNRSLSRQPGSARYCGLDL